MSQVNISLMNTETSINFDGNGIQSRAEAEYRKEEERQQNELKGLLKEAFDDLIDDDLLSVTSEDSANISGCSESKTPVNGNSGNDDNGTSNLPSTEQVAQELDAMANRMQHTTFGLTYDVDNQTAKSQPSNAYHPGNYSTNATTGSDSNLNRQQTFNDCGVVEQTDATDHHHGNQPIPDSEIYHLTNEHLQQHNHHNDQWQGNPGGYGHDDEQAQVPPPHLHHFHYHDPQYSNFYTGRLQNDRLIEGREREEAEGGNDVMFADTQGQVQWSQGHTHNVGYGQTEVKGSNSVQPSHNPAYSHDRGEYEMKGGNMVPPLQSTAYSHERGEYEIKGGNSAIPSHTVAYSYDREYETPRSEENYVPPLQMHNMHGYTDDGYQRLLHTDSYPTDTSNQQNHPSSHASLPTSHFVSSDPVPAMAGSNSNTQPEYQENYKVQYRHTKTGGVESNTNSEKEMANIRGQQRREDSQKEFVSQDISDGGQLTQLQILYKARGRKLEELTNLLESYKQEHGRELRILKHQLSMVQAEKEGVETSYKQCQELLQEAKGDNSTLTGQLRAAELQISTLKDVKEDLVKQIQASECTIESLTQHVADLSQSDSVTRARNDHDAVISSLQQRHSQELLTLKQNLDSAREKILEQETMILTFKRQMAEQTQLLEQAQISRAESINRLTRSLEESQRQCQALLESSSSQELSQIKIQLNQAVASKRISDDMYTSLQSEVRELKEQLTMYESASGLGVFSRSQPMGSNDDSMLDLGIRKTLDFNTPDSNSRGGRMHGEITLRLKSELEKCVTSNSQKRGLISKLKDELRVAKEEIATLKERCQRAEKNAEEYQKKLKEFEELVQPGNKMTAMESRMNKEMDNLKNERTILLEDIEDLKKRLNEVAKSEEALSEINMELNKRMSDMVKEYDADKREALERCQRASDQVHEVTKHNLRQELMSEFSIERAQIVTRYESEIGQLRSDLSSAQQEIDEIKELYVKACAENNKLGEKLQGEFDVKHKKELDKIKEELTSEKDKEMKKVHTEMKDSARGDIREEMKREFEATFNSEVEAKVASLKREWMEDVKQSQDLAVENAINAAKTEWTSQHEATFEMEVETRVEAAKSRWMTEKQLASYSELQREKEKWKKEADDRLEEEIKKAVNHARTEWGKSLAEGEKSESENFKQDIEDQIKERVNEEVEKRIATEKSTWQLEADVKLGKEIRSQIKLERTRWQLEHDHLVEVEVELAVKQAKKNWATTAEEQKKMSEEEHEEILENEKLKWQRESRVVLKEELRTAVEAREQELEKQFRERQKLDTVRFEEKLKAERKKWMQEADEKLQAEIKKAVDACEQELKRDFQERQRQDELRFESLKAEREVWMREAEGRLQEEVRKIVEQEQIAASALEQGMSREDMNSHIQSEVANAVENTKLECEKHFNVTKTLLEQEIDSIKCENGRLKHDLRAKECEWIERREALVSQKDAERRQGVKDVQDQCQQDYQRFISDHQDVLNRALKEARDKHELEKVTLQQSYEEKIQNLHSEKQQLLHELRYRELNHDTSGQENSVLNVSLDVERQVWQKERQKLKKSVATREKLLKSADSHMANEMEKLKAELEDAYQTQLAAEMAGVEEKCERLANEVSEKQKYVHGLEEEIQLLRTKVVSLETPYKQEIVSLKQRQQELNSQLKKTEKCLQDAQNHHHRELKAAEAENKDVMENTRKKLSEMKNSHVAAVETVKKQHVHEKRDLLKQLKRFTDRTVANIGVQTENWEELQLLELRVQYVETVKKIKEDVIQHISVTNRQAAETIKEGVCKERQVYVKQLKNFYKNSVFKILRNELTGAELESKLSIIDRALEELATSLCSSASATPPDTDGENHDRSGQTSLTSGTVTTPRSGYSFTGSESSSQGQGNGPAGSELSSQGQGNGPAGALKTCPKSYDSNIFEYTSASFHPLQVVDMTDSFDESRAGYENGNRGKSVDSFSEFVTVRDKPPRRLNSDVVQLTDSPNNVVTLRPNPTRQPRSNGDNKLIQSKTFGNSQHASLPLGQVSDGSAFRKNRPSAQELRLDLSSARVLKEERFTKPPVSCNSPVFGTNKKVSNTTSQTAKSMEEEFMTPQLSTFQPKLSKAKSDLTLNKLASSTGFSTTGMRVNYTYTPLNQSVNNASPSTSLLSTCSLSDGDLRLVGQHLPFPGEVSAKDEPVLLNLNCLGLGNPSPRKFNPAPERLDDRYSSVRSSDRDFTFLPESEKTNSDRARSAIKESGNRFKEYPGKNNLQFGLVSMSNDFTDIAEQTSQNSAPTHGKSLQDLTSFSISSPKDEQMLNKINKVLHFSHVSDYLGDESSVSGHRSFRTVESDKQVFVGKPVQPRPLFRESKKGRRSYDDVYPRDKLARHAAGEHNAPLSNIDTNGERN